MTVSGGVDAADRIRTCAVAEIHRRSHNGHCAICRTSRSGSRVSENFSCLWAPDCEVDVLAVVAGATGEADARCDARRGVLFGVGDRCQSRDVRRSRRYRYRRCAVSDGSDGAQGNGVGSSVCEARNRDWACGIRGGEGREGPAVQRILVVGDRRRASDSRGE